MVWALLLPPMLGPGSLWASPALSFLALVGMAMGGWGRKESHSTRGLCTLGRGGALVSRTGTSSLGPSRKKDPRQCRGTLPGLLQAVSHCSF